MRSSGLIWQVRHTPVAGGLATWLALATLLAADPAGPPAPSARDRSPSPVRESPETSFEAHGIDIGLASKADVLSKVHGGHSPAAVARYRGHLELVTTLDTAKLGLWDGGTVVLVAQNGHGRGLSDVHVGDVQVLSNIDARSFTQMSEWFLEQALLQGRLRLKVGRQDAAVDFGPVEFGAEFLNSSFGVIPTNPLPTFPDPALGVSAFVDVTRALSVGIGVYSATPVRWGLIRGTTFGAEVGYAPGSTLGEKATRYRAGLWCERDPRDPGTPATTSVYAVVDQVLFREGADDQGLSGFVQAGTSSGAPNGVSGYVGAGVAYTGLLPGRDGDLIGLGVAHARLAEWLDRGGAETDIELLYRVSPWPWLTLQPSLHWVLRPGGERTHAVVAGLRVETAF